MSPADKKKMKALEEERARLKAALEAKKVRARIRALEKRQQATASLLDVSEDGTGAGSNLSGYGDLLDKKMGLAGPVGVSRNEGAQLILSAAGLRQNETNGSGLTTRDVARLAALAGGA